MPPAERNTKAKINPVGGIAASIPVVVDRTYSMGELAALAQTHGVLFSRNQATLLNRLNLFYSEHPEAPRP